MEARVNDWLVLPVLCGFVVTLSSAVCLAQNALPVFSADVERVREFVAADGSARVERSTGVVTRDETGATWVEIDGKKFRRNKRLAEARPDAQASARAATRGAVRMQLVKREDLGDRVVAGTPCRQRRETYLIPKGAAKNSRAIRFERETCYSADLDIAVESKLWNSQTGTTMMETVKVHR